MVDNFKTNIDLESKEDFLKEIKRHEDVLVEYINKRVSLKLYTEDDLFFKRVLFSTFLLGLSFGQLYNWAITKFVGRVDDTDESFYKPMKKILRDLEKRVGV